MDKNNIQVVSFKFDIQKPPIFKEQRGKDWINYGIDAPYKNQYPQFLIDLYNRSSKHNAIIEGKAEFISANGWEVVDTNIDLAMRGKMDALLRDANESESLDDILDKVARDLELFNGFALQVIKKKVSGYNIYHLPFQDIRSNKDNTEFYVSEDWSKTRVEYDTFEAFNFENPSADSIYYVTIDRPGAITYPLPSYIGAIPNILTDIEIANFHYNSIKNGFVAGTLINLLNGEPETKEAKEEIYRDITKKLTGSDNANSVLLNFADGKDRAAEVHSLIGNDFDKRFRELNETVRKEIFTGHRITDPQLFGIFKDGAFTNSSELVESWTLFQNTYITKRQTFLEDAFNSLIIALGYKGKLNIRTVEPISASLSEATIVSVMTRDEIRERAGLPKLNDDEVKQIKPQSFEEEAEIKVAKRFSNIGYSLDKWEIVKSRKIEYVDHAQIMRDDKFAFAPVPSLQASILDLINKDAFLTSVAISETLNISLEQVMEQLTILGREGYLKYTPTLIGDARQRVGELTSKGKEVLDESVSVARNFRIAYRYVVRDDAGAPIIPTTRPFCREMVNASENRVWDASQITTISLEENRNVWLRGGGFWTRKGTNITTPHCRHEWEQVVIKERE